MSDVVAAILLGIVQGLTEFLPVSSSGHLVIAHHLLHFAEGDVFFDVVLHVATLFVVFAVFYQDIVAVFRPLWSGGNEEKKSSTNLILWVVLGSVPAAIFGLTAKDFIESMFSSASLVGLLLVINGLILLLPRWLKPATSIALKNIGLGRAFIIGVAQAAAIFPGISRAGSTITTGMLTKVNPTDAARFSFFLFMPAVGGAALLQVKDALETNTTILWGPLIAGFIAAVVTGWFALNWLLKTLKRGSFHRFGYYCIVVGLISLIYFR